MHVMIETLEDIIESLADKLRVYGVHEVDEQRECRVCFAANLRARIQRAVEIDRKLNG